MKLLAGVFLLAPWLVASVAGAQDLRLEVRSCPHLSPDHLRSLLALELRTIGGARDMADVSVRVTCSEAGTAIVANVAQVTQRRTISGSPHVLSERDLALAASEVVAEIWERPVEPPARQSETSAPPADTGEKHTRMVSLFGEVGRLRRPARLVPGGGLGFSFSPAAHAELGVLLSLAAGRISTEQAFVDQISFAIHPRARFGPSWGRVRLLFGVSFPFGIAHFSPRARVEGAREQRLTAAWFAVVGDFGAHLPLSERVFLLSDFYAGTVLAPVRGLVDAESLIELSGPLVGARLGFGLAL